jgi:hypothetical protein
MLLVEIPSSPRTFSTDWSSRVASTGNGLWVCGCFKGRETEFPRTVLPFEWSQKRSIISRMAELDLHWLPGDVALHRNQEGGITRMLVSQRSARLVADTPPLLAEAVRTHTAWAGHVVRWELNSAPVLHENLCLERTNPTCGTCALTYDVIIPSLRT